MRRACVSTVRSTEAKAQPAARRPERSEGTRPKIHTLYIKHHFLSFHT
ncbi:MAG: hypothetical protein RML94_12125 [Bacteroidia bacterium]|nr:hypothetical protein [Bacteroidia bacterium]